MTLLEKLSTISEEMRGLSKGGTNNHNKYQYVKGEDAMRKFRELEISNRIKVLPTIKSETVRVELTEKGQITTAVIDYNIFDLDSSEKQIVSIVGQGYDSTDKSAYKMMTGAFKYFLLQTFSYSTDDPEDDDKMTEHNVGKTKKTSVKATEKTSKSEETASAKPAFFANRFKTKSTTKKETTSTVEAAANTIGAIEATVKTETVAPAPVETQVESETSDSAKPVFKRSKFKEMLASKKKTEEATA